MRRCPFFCWSLNRLNISLTHIVKTYEESRGRRLIFDNASIRFPSRKRTVVIGKSGVGKSSLLNLISGIDVPDKGRIQVGESDVTAMDDDERTLFRRRHIGFVYQFFNLMPVLTVLENVLLITDLDGRPDQAARDRAMLLLERVGLLERKDHYPDRLSGGEQQRVAIVRSLVNKPDILLADEPTGNLDTETGRAILEMMSQLVETEKNTLVMVTHSPDAIQYADAVFQVKDHRIIPRETEYRGP